MQVYKHRGRVIHSQLILSPVVAGCNVQRPFHSRYACEVSNGAQRAPMSALKRIADSSHVAPCPKTFTTTEVPNRPKLSLSRGRSSSPQHRRIGETVHHSGSPALRMPSISNLLCLCH